MIILQFSGPDPGLMKTVNVGSGSITIDQFDTRSGTSFGHSVARGGLGVGAADYRDTPAFGQSPPLIETSSSAGGTPIFFDTAGNRLATPEVRAQPAITAPDGANTTFFIPGVDPEADGFPNFFGTSAAAPHAAGVAALITDLHPSIGADAVYSVLKTTAVDMDDPATLALQRLRLPHWFRAHPGRSRARCIATATPAYSATSGRLCGSAPATTSATSSAATTTAATGHPTARGPARCHLSEQDLQGPAHLPGHNDLLHQPCASHGAGQCRQARKWPRSVGQGAPTDQVRLRRGQRPAGYDQHLQAPAHQESQELRQEDEREETPGQLGG